MAWAQLPAPPSLAFAGVTPASPQVVAPEQSLSVLHVVGQATCRTHTPWVLAWFAWQHTSPVPVQSLL